MEEAKSRNESLEAENGAAREGSMRFILDLELFQADLTWLLRAEERDNGSNRAIAAALRSLARFRQEFADNKELEWETDDVKARYDQELARLSQELADTKTRLELACHVSEIVVPSSSSPSPPRSSLSDEEEELGRDARRHVRRQDQTEGKGCDHDEGHMDDSITTTTEERERRGLNVELDA